MPRGRPRRTAQTYGNAVDPRVIESNAFTTYLFPDGTFWENPYVPSENQKLYHSATERYVLYGGARGGGKTRAEVEDIAGTMLRWPGIPILMFRKDLQDLKRTFLVEWLAHVPEQLYDPKNGGQYHRTDNIFRFPNGATLYLSEMKDVESWRSATLGRVYGDEMHEVPDGENVLREINGTLRWTTGEGECKREECARDAKLFDLENKQHAIHPIRQVKMATNPHGGWLKSRFYTPYHEGQERPGHRYIPATVFDNPSADPSYIAGLMSNNAQWVRNFVYGDWQAFDNMAYPNFSRPINLWRGPVPWAQVSTIEGGIDWGSPGTESHRTAMYLTAKLRSGILITFWEHSVQGVASSPLFAKIREMTSKHRVSRWWSDASQFIANDQLRAAGVPVSDAPRHQGAVKDGVNLGNRIMAPDATGKPQWYVTEDCPRLMAGLESYSVDATTGLFIKRDDDEVDAWRYNIMSLATKTEHHPVSLDTVVKHPVSRKDGASSILLRRRAERTERMRIALEGEKRWATTRR